MSTSFQLQRIINLLNHLRSDQSFIIDTMLNDERQFRRFRRHMPMPPSMAVPSPMSTYIPMSMPMSMPTSRQMSAPNNNMTTTENIEISFSEPRNSELLNTIFGGLFQQQNESTPTLTLSDVTSKTEVFAFTSNEGDEPQLCPICRVNFQNNDIVRKISHCGHMYHLNCIDNWFNENTTCPVCRHNLLTPENQTIPQTQTTQPINTNNSVSV